jgi:hypothetical protein
MRKHIYLTASFVLLLVFSPFVRAQTPGDSIFEVSTIHDLRIEFSQPGFWDSLDTYYNDGNEQMLMGMAIFNGDTIDSVGVRIKGNSSYFHANDKKSMIVDFNEYVSGQNWLGVKKILLNNNWSDPTMMREKITFDFCNKIGIACPRSTYGNLYLNGTAWGIYSIVEAVDKTFLGSRFPENDGNLFKAVDAFTMGGTPPTSDLKWYGFTDADYYDHYELKTNETINDWSDLRRLIDTLAFASSASMSTALPSLMNMDNFYSHHAVDIMLVNTDAYVRSARNYYLYHNLATDQFEWIHWDANMSFAGYSGSPSLGVTYVTSSAERPLLTEMYANATLKDEYLQRLCALHRDYLNNAYFDPIIDSIADAIRASVYADWRKEYSNTQFENNLTNAIADPFGPPGSTIYGLKDFIESRDASITSQLSALGYSCILSNTDVALDDAMSAVVHPNPFQDQITVDRTNPSAEWGWQVTDLTGNGILAGNLPAGAGSAQIEMADLASGMYLLTLTNERGERHTVRILRM